MAKKRKLQGLSAQTTPRSRSRTRPDPGFSPGPDPIARTPFSAGSVTPVQSLKSVLLSDWWLRRAQGKGLAVAGFETTGGSGVRLFTSAPIAKRHDSTTLETVEGITISISGLIDRPRTLQHGFSSEVCNHFLLGFPYYWEDYASPLCGEEEKAEKHDRTTEARIASFEDASASFSTVSFDDLHVSRLYDLLMSPLFSPEDCLKKKTLDEELGRLRHCSTQGNRGKEQSDRRCETSVDSVNSGGEERKDHDKTLTPSTGVKTRSMLRRMTMQEEENGPVVSSFGKRIHNTRVSGISRDNRSLDKEVEKGTKKSVLKSFLCL